MITEQQLHKAVAQYLSWALAPPAFWTTFPAGGGGQMRGKILSGLGMKKGVPDIILIHDSRAHFIELKSAKGVLSPAQREVHEALARAGCPVAVCRNIDDVRALFGPTGRWWPIPIRETKPVTEAIRRGFAEGVSQHVVDYHRELWPESTDLGRRRRK